jgi:hypothetical protein
VECYIVERVAALCFAGKGRVDDSGDDFSAGTSISVSGVNVRVAYISGMDDIPIPVDVRRSRLLDVARCKLRERHLKRQMGVEPSFFAGRKNAVRPHFFQMLFSNASNSGKLKAQGFYWSCCFDLSGEFSPNQSTNFC